MRVYGLVGMAYKYKTEVKREYNLAAEALDYLADKLSSIRDDDDEQLRVKNELIKQELDVNVDEWRQKARRLRELYYRPGIPNPPAGSRQRERYIIAKEEEDNFVNSIKGLICFALGVYANDIIKTRQDIARKIIIREPSAEYVQAFLKMDDVEAQLKIIDEMMRRDYCGK
jgi:hypothetical protein